MELFSEIKNSTIREIINALNLSVVTNSSISKTDLTKAICSNDILSPAEESLIQQIFMEDSQKPGYLLPKIHSSIPNLPTILELQWLVNFLNDSKSNLLLSPSTKATLQAQLSDYPPTPNIWEQQGWNHAPIPQHTYYSDLEYIKIFKLCYEALQENKKVYYESYDEFGNQYSGIASPYKFEYCITTNSFNFIMWNEEKKWTFKSDVATITKIVLQDENVEPDVYTKATNYVEAIRAQAEPIRLKVKDKNNALVRCFLLLAAYEKDLIKKEDDNSFIIDIFHRTHFDEADILQCILSLGNPVTVISPPTFREKVIEYITQSFTR